jgi:lipopolysaccharide cholinephosphotransferase
MEDCKKVGSLFFDFDTTRFVWDKHCFDEVFYMPFENMMLPVVSGYKELLTTQYGDYMTPVKAPSYHSGFWKLDAERSYKEYLPELKRSYRKERIKTYKRKIKKTVKKLLGKG